MAHAILIIEDEEVLGRNMLHYLQRAGYDAQLAVTAMQGLALHESMQPDMVVLDYHLPDLDGLQVLERIRARDPAARVIMLTGHGSVELAVQAMRAGSFDFLTKPVALAQLKLRIEQAVGQQRKDSALSYYRERDASHAVQPGLIGQSPPMLALQRTIGQLLEAEAQLRDADAPALLLLGESGVGKEVLARAVHASSLRHTRPFVALNCAALPEELIESRAVRPRARRLHRRGRRRSASVRDRRRRHHLPRRDRRHAAALQAKLLRVLQERRVLSGWAATRPVRVRRVRVAATHRNLEQRCETGKFREDLYYRLNVVTDHGRRRCASARRRAAAGAALHGRRWCSATATAPADHRGGLRRPAQAHTWPGNVRELRNVLEQAVLLNHHAVIDVAQLGMLAAAPAAPGTPPAAAAALAAAQSGADGGAGGSDATLPGIERQALLQALRSNGWNVSRAARALGISRDTLRYRIEKHGLAAPPVPAFAESQR
jgi:DNA-binding NtrC family response regulator